MAAKSFEPGAVPVALVLSGGAARGFAHIGVIKVLEANGLKPDLVVGTSAGAIIGAFYASGMTAAELEAVAREMGNALFTDFVLPGFGFNPGELGFVRGEKVQRFLAARLKHPHIQDFPIRFAALATDLATGTPVVFNSGDAALALVASSAVPGVIVPVRVGNKYFADGQIASPLPIRAAQALGAKIVIAVDVVYPPEDAFLSSAVSVLFQAFTIAVHQLKLIELPFADLVIAPTIGKTSGQMRFSDREQLMAAGEQAATRVLPELKAKFAR